MSAEGLRELLLADDDERMQTALGLMRACELRLLGRVVRYVGATGYVSVGCGSCYEHLAMPSGVEVLGLEISEPDLRYAEGEDLAPRVSLVVTDVWRGAEPDRMSSEVEAIIEDFVRTRRPDRVVFYTDNGHKLREMRALVRLAEVGDVIGTHDWGEDDVTTCGTATEVRDDRCGFLLDAGFKVLEEVQPWIRKHRCLQRFWIRRRSP